MMGKPETETETETEIGPGGYGGEGFVLELLVFSEGGLLMQLR